MNILQIHSSARPAETAGGSVSARLADEVVAGLMRRHADAHRTLRDLARTPHPALDEAALQALFTPPAQRSLAQAARVALDDALIAEVQAADTLVLAVPMYNFGITALLKNWIDAIARAKVTFEYTEHGPRGLLIGKRVYVVLTRAHRGYTGSRKPAGHGRHGQRWHEPHACTRASRNTRVRAGINRRPGNTAHTGEGGRLHCGNTATRLPLASAAWA